MLSFRSILRRTFPRSASLSFFLSGTTLVLKFQFSQAFVWTLPLGTHLLQQRGDQCDEESLECHSNANQITGFSFPPKYSSMPKETPKNCANEHLQHRVLGDAFASNRDGKYSSEARPGDHD